MYSFTKARKSISFLLCLLFLALCSVALGAEAIQVTDMKSRTTTLEGPITRIVATAPSDCEILFALDAGHLLVGRGMDCDYPAEVADIPIVNSGLTTNVEQIIALQPQAVLMNTMAQTLEQVAALEAAGIPILSTDTSDLEGVYEAITMIGAITGKTDEATALCQQMQDAFTAVSTKATDGNTQTIYFEVSPLEYGLWTAGKNTFMDHIATLCGLTNIFGDVDGWAQISEEQVLTLNPDYIVTLTPTLENSQSPSAEIMSRPGWESITAVVQNQIMVSNDNTMVRPGPRLMEAAEALYAFTHQQ